MGRSRFSAGTLPSSLITAIGLSGILVVVVVAWRFGGPREMIATALVGTPAARHLAAVDWLLAGWFATALIGTVAALLAHLRAETPRETEALDLDGELVLVVDSDRARRREILGALEERGAVGLEAVDGGDVVEFLEAEPPDVVVFRETPEADAETLRRLIAARESDRPPDLVVLSGAGATSTISRLSGDSGPIEIARAVFETAERRRIARAAAPPIIDFDLVRSVVGGSDGDAVDMLWMFTRSVEEPVSRLANGSDADFEPTREAAHRVCGAARTAGVERLARALAALERAALDRDRRRVDDARREIEREFTVFKETLARRADASSFETSLSTETTDGGPR